MVPMLLLLFLVSFGSYKVEGCSCLGFSHLQDSYCESDFVIRVKITAMDHDCPPGACPGGNSVGDGFYIYSTANMKVYKSTAAFDATDKQIWTRDADAACGMYLEVGKTYLLTGSVSDNKPWVFLCSSHSIGWGDVTSFQKKALKKTYKKNCNSKAPCEVCVFDCQGPPDVDTCNFPSVEDQYCYRQHSICRRKKGVCKFQKSKALKKCLA